MNLITILKILRTYFRPNILVILFLGLSAGLPIVVILGTIKAVLVDQGVNIKIIGGFALVSLPYSIKFLWAPLVDSMSIPILSKKYERTKSNTSRNI